MLDANMTLLCSGLEAVLRELEADPANAAAWAEAQDALVRYEVGPEDDPELAAAIEARDRERLNELVCRWVSGERLLLERDRGVLKRALKAFRKRLKVTVLDAESSVAGGPMSAGRESHIVGIVPPERYPREVWDHLARQKRLSDRGKGTYELGPNA